MYSRLQKMSVALSAAFATAATFAADAQCSAMSGARVPVVIELYTSEGCDSCPPADRWLSSVVARKASDAPVIALAFHVDYWDYIGWKDAFAQPAFAERQRALATRGGASGVYTPQVFNNGRDDRSWTSRSVNFAIGGTATVRFNVASNWSDDSVNLTGKFADVASLPAGVRLRFALTENGLVTAVKAGENKGVTLKHDAVVRAHGAAAVDATGAFVANARVARDVKRSSTQLQVIAEDARGVPLAAATLACAI